MYNIKINYEFKIPSGTEPKDLDQRDIGEVVKEIEKKTETKFDFYPPIKEERGVRTYILQTNKEGTNLTIELSNYVQEFSPEEKKKLKKIKNLLSPIFDSLTDSPFPDFPESTSGIECKIKYEGNEIDKDIVEKAYNAVYEVFSSDSEVMQKNLSNGLLELFRDLKSNKKIDE